MKYIVHFELLFLEEEPTSHSAKALELKSRILIGKILIGLQPKYVFLGLQTLLQRLQKYK